MASLGFQSSDFASVFHKFIASQAGIKQKQFVINVSFTK